MDTTSMAGMSQARWTNGRNINPIVSRPVRLATCGQQQREGEEAKDKVGGEMTVIMYGGEQAAPHKKDHTLSQRHAPPALIPVYGPY